MENMEQVQEVISTATKDVLAMPKMEAFVANMEPSNCVVAVVIKGAPILHKREE